MSGYGCVWIGILTFLLAGSAHGQNPKEGRLRNELRFMSANDNFFPPFHDRYFTNGLSITFSRMLDDGFLRNGEVSGGHYKSIFHFGLGQMIYTPNSITEQKITEFDRPYAAYLFLKPSISLFWWRRNSLVLGLDIGLIGPKAGGERVQSWWHKLLSLDEPRGWRYQISDELLLNFGFKYQHSWWISPRFDLISTIKAQAGTAFDDLYFGLMARTGNPGPIDRSAITNSLLNNNNSSRAREWFLFWEFSNAFVFHNTLIDGSLLHPSKNVHTEHARSQYFISKAGIAFSKRHISWIFSMYHLTPEVTGGKGHTYGSIELAVRF